jgi:hypothetical protein
LHVNDTHIDIHNPIFKALHKIYTKWQYILSILPLHHPPPKPTLNSINTEAITLQTFKRPHHDKGNTNTQKERTRTAGASVTKTPRRVERSNNSWPQQYQQERHIHNLDKWTTLQEGKSFKNKNKKNFKDEILKTKHFKQNNLSKCQ